MLAGSELEFALLGSFRALVSSNWLVLFIKSCWTQLL